MPSTDKGEPPIDFEVDIPNGALGHRPYMAAGIPHVPADSLSVVGRPNPADPQYGLHIRMQFGQAGFFARLSEEEGTALANQIMAGVLLMRRRRTES